MASLFQQCRSELKFEISEQLAVDIKRYIGATLQQDANSRSFGDCGYPVCSVYLDSADSVLCSQTVDGKRNRYKLRVRVYDNVPEHPAFLEIKRRDGQMIKKQRATVDRRTATSILAGDRGAFESLAYSSGDAKTQRREWMALTEFCQLRDMIGAVGTTYVSYLRDAYVSPDGNDLRATFDRKLQAHPYVPGELITIPAAGTAASSDGLVVFELKFTNRFPRWMQDLVRVFDLSAVSYPKYVNCVESLGLPVSSYELSRAAADAATQRAG